MNIEHPQGIGKLVADLKNESRLDNSRVADIVKSNKIHKEEFDAFTSFNHCNTKSYGRRLIFKNENFKVLLMSWKAGDFTAIHNHGFTDFGCVLFLGDTVHRLYQIKNNQLFLLQKNTFNKGEMVSVSGELTHLMGNSGTTDFATLHIYGNNSGESNALENAKVYVPEHQKIVTTLGSAYLNMDKEFIVEEKPLKCENYEVLNDYFTLVKPFYERNNLTNVIKNMEARLGELNT